MLYHTAFKALASVLEILNTSRKSIAGWSAFAANFSVPCQVPTMSVGETGVAVGAAVCAAGGVVCALTCWAGRAESNSGTAPTQRQARLACRLLNLCLRTSNFKVM